MSTAAAGGAGGAAAADDDDDDLLYECTQMTLLATAVKFVRIVVAVGCFYVFVTFKALRKTFVHSLFSFTILFVKRNQIQ